MNTVTFHPRAIISKVALLAAVWVAVGCSDTKTSDPRYNDQATVDALLELDEGIPKQAFYESVREGPLYVLLRSEVTRRAAKRGKAATSAGDEQWFYASDDKGFYIVEIEGEEVLWVAGPFEGDVHAFIADGW
ncbi:MAG: hypothetical protein AAGI37_03415 [Planctomycetota bacterium]